MSQPINPRVEKIREFNRFYTNIIGLVNQSILESPYSLAEGRVMLEIDKAGTCMASDLIKLLMIDAGYLSRMLNRFEKEQLLTREKSLTDKRVQTLSLTEKGKTTFHDLSTASSQQITDLLNSLSDSRQEKLVNCMETVKDILTKKTSDQITIRTAKPGDLGYIAYRHGVLYELEYQLEPIFETYVLDSLLKFARSPLGGTIWIAESNGQIAGFIAIIQIDEESAQLRWFLIEPEYRGIGLGRRLMSIAMEHCCEKRFKKVFLWTFKGLDAATTLYKRNGFVLTEQVPSDTWKQGVMEERWELTPFTRK